jgi:hypothetical protein
MFCFFRVDQNFTSFLNWLNLDSCWAIIMLTKWQLDPVCQICGQMYKPCNYMIIFVITYPDIPRRYSISVTLSVEYVVCWYSSKRSCYLLVYKKANKNNSQALNRWGEIHQFNIFRLNSEISIIFYVTFQRINVTMYRTCVPVCATIDS